MKWHSHVCGEHAHRTPPSPQEVLKQSEEKDEAEVLVWPLSIKLDVSFRSAWARTPQRPFLTYSVLLLSGDSPVALQVEVQVGWQQRLPHQTCSRSHLDESMLALFHHVGK